MNEQTNKQAVMSLRPRNDYKKSEGTGYDLPGNLTPIAIAIDVKPERIPGFWSKETMHLWLLDDVGTNCEAPPDPDEIRNKPPEAYLNIPLKDERFHTAVNSDTGAVIENRLFKTVGLDYTIKGKIDMMQLAARAQSDNAYTEYLA